MPSHNAVLRFAFCPGSPWHPTATLPILLRGCRCCPHPAAPATPAVPAVLQDLIKYSLPHDVWFHVDALSSAHVYLRLPEGACVLPCHATTCAGGLLQPLHMCVCLAADSPVNVCGYVSVCVCVLQCLSHGCRQDDGRHPQGHSGGRLPAGEGQQHPGGWRVQWMQ